MIIDATDLILGRMAGFAAKKALLGETIEIVNAEKAVVTGNPKKILDDYKRQRARGPPLKGPYYPRTAERIVKRTIRGMLPYKTPRGREALKRVKCHVGTPKALEGKSVAMEEFSVHNTHANYIAVKDISKGLGGKID